MLSYTELKKGTFFVWNGEPYEVLESGFLRMQQRKAVMQTKIRNLVNGKIIDRNWQASDQFEEAEIERKNVVFIYSHRGEYWFTEENNPKERFSLSEAEIGDAGRFLKKDTPLSALLFKGKVIKIVPPVKVDLKVTEAPPSVKGNTAQGGTKQITLESGASITVPLFINEGDIVRVNTETGEYVERAEKK